MFRWTGGTRARADQRSQAADTPLLLAPILPSKGTQRNPSPPSHQPSHAETRGAVARDTKPQPPSREGQSVASLLPENEGGRAARDAPGTAPVTQAAARLVHVFRSAQEQTGTHEGAARTDGSPPLLPLEGNHGREHLGPRPAGTPTRAAREKLTCPLRRKRFHDAESTDRGSSESSSTCRSSSSNSSGERAWRPMWGQNRRGSPSSHPHHGRHHSGKRRRQEATSCHFQASRCGPQPKSHTHNYSVMDVVQTTSTLGRVAPSATATTSASSQATSTASVRRVREAVAQERRRQRVRTATGAPSLDCLALRRPVGPPPPLPLLPRDEGSTFMGREGSVVGHHRPHPQKQQQTRESAVDGGLWPCASFSTQGVHSFEDYPLLPAHATGAPGRHSTAVTQEVSLHPVLPDNCDAARSEACTGSLHVSNAHASSASALDHSHDDAVNADDFLVDASGSLHGRRSSFREQAWWNAAAQENQWGRPSVPDACHDSRRWGTDVDSIPLYDPGINDDRNEGERSDLQFLLSSPSPTQTWTEPGLDASQSATNFLMLGPEERDSHTSFPFQGDSGHVEPWATGHPGFDGSFLNGPTNRAPRQAWSDFPVPTDSLRHQANPSAQVTNLPSRQCSTVADIASGYITHGPVQRAHAMASASLARAVGQSHTRAAYPGILIDTQAFDPLMPPNTVTHSSHGRGSGRGEARYRRGASGAVGRSAPGDEAAPWTYVRLPHDGRGGDRLGTRHRGGGGETTRFHSFRARCKRLDDE